MGWFTGLLVYWFTGLLVYWFTGLLVYWFTLFSFNCLNPSPPSGGRGAFTGFLECHEYKAITIRRTGKP